MDSMPTYTKHCEFVSSRPYKHWYFIEDTEIYGAIDLFLHPCRFYEGVYEIGIFLFERFKYKGIGTQSFTLLLKKHPEIKTYIANIHPYNEASRTFFEKLGFKHIQQTYEYEVGDA